MAEFERIEKVSYLRIFTHNINKRKFMISCCEYKAIYKDIIIIIVIIIIYLLYHSLCWCLFIHQPDAYHARGASNTQIIHSDHFDFSLITHWGTRSLFTRATSDAV